MPDFKTTHALVLSVKPLNEKSFIIALLTAENGKHLGVFKGKTPPQTGTCVHARWQARLSEQLGTFYLESDTNPSVLYMDDKARLACILSLCTLLNELLPERQPYTDFYKQVAAFLTQLDTPDFILNYIRLEFNLLKELGFGLDTSACAGGGDPHDLAYISPKTGHAVSREKGAPYKTKLLRLPHFLLQQQLSDFASQQQLPDFASQQQLSDFTSQQQLPDFTSQQQLSDFASQQQLSDFTSQQQLPDFTSKQELSNFLVKQKTAPTPADIADGLFLTGYFLLRQAGLKKLPLIREQILS